MEIQFQKLDSIADLTTSPWYVYVWEAPPWSAFDAPVWTITRINTTTLESRFWKSDTTLNLKDRMINKWTDRESLIY